MRRNILITGAAGRIGRCLTKEFRALDIYNIVATDIQEDEQENIVKLDVTDGNRLQELTRNIDTILHIGWAPEEEDFLGKVLPINVTGAYHIYEAARINGVKRVIFASSNHATGFYKVDEEIEANDPYRPDSFYGLSKCYIELLGRFYSDKYDISSFNIRIGMFPGDNRPSTERAAHIFISERDMIQLAKCCIEADESIKFLAGYGTSDNTDNYYNIDDLAESIGYRPQDNAAELIEEMRKHQINIKKDETAYQGGGVTVKEMPR